jgi:hypothetical protein
MRPGFQAMMREALQKKFDIVMAEALDRFSRDQEDTAGQKVIDAIVAGVKGSELKDRMAQLQDRSAAEADGDRGRTAAAPSPEHGRPLPGQGGGTRVSAPARGHASAGLGNAPGPYRFDRLDSG